MNGRRLLALMLALALVAPALSRAEDPARDQSKTSLLGDFWKDGKAIWTSPFHLKAKHLLPLGAAAAATILLVWQDEGIYRAAGRLRTSQPWVADAGPVVTKLGETPYPHLMAALMIAGGSLAKDKKAVATGVMGLEAMIQATLVAQVAKLITSRQRPYVDDGQDRWYGPAGIWRRFEENAFSKYNSFPSGHTVTAWSLATVIAHQYNGRPWVPALCYGLAGLVALSRVTEQQHYGADVFAGALLGFAVGKMVVLNHRRRRASAPVILPTGTGLSLLIPLG